MAERSLVCTGRRSLVALIGAVAALTVGMMLAPAARAAPDSLGNEFWLMFPGNIGGGSQKSLFLTGPESASGTVEIPGLAFSQPFTVTPGTVTTVDLPNNTDMEIPEGTEQKGIHVTSDREVTVYGLNRQSATTDAYLGLPVDVLGTSNIALGIGTGLGGTSEFGIAASQDATTVTITPKVDGGGGRTAGTPYDVVLNRGDSYQLRAAIAQEDLSGSIINADKPIAVYGGHQCANIPNQNFFACDHVVEQMPPTDAWGTNFGTVPLKTRTNGDTFRIVASEDGTQVSINGTPVVSLNRGDVHQQIIDGNSRITANNPVLVGQYSNSTTFDNAQNADPFEMLNPPLEQFLAGYTVSTPASGFTTNVVNLVVPDSAIGNVAVDGTAVPPAAYTPIPNSGFSGAQVDVNLGAHNLTGNQPFGVYSYGFGSFDSYGYAGGQSFAPIALVNSIAVEPPAATHPVGTEQCVTATALSQNNTGVPGVRIDFLVQGANTASGFQSADNSGRAQFCYTGSNLGDDTITASVGQISGTATKAWVTPQPPSEQSAARCAGEPATIVGTSGNDTLQGTPERDVISAGGGDDTIRANAGNDLICAGPGKDDAEGAGGNDTVRGGGGDDDLRASKGKDNVKGNNGDDVIGGGAENDRLVGNKGNDKVRSRNGEDVLKGRNGKDDLRGNEANDTLGGGKGDDFLNGGKGKNDCNGGPGDNKLRRC